MWHTPGNYNDFHICNFRSILHVLLKSVIYEFCAPYYIF